MANRTIIFHDAVNGQVIPVLAIDKGDGTYLLGVDAADVQVGDITVTSVPIKDGSTATLANVDAPASLTPSSKALAVHDPAPVATEANIGAKAAGFSTPLGVAGAAFTSADQSGGVAAVTDAPTSGMKLVITDLIISSLVAQVLTFTEETSGTVLLKLYVPANGSPVISPAGKIKLPTADKKLMVRSSILGAISVTALYYSES